MKEIEIPGSWVVFGDGKVRFVPDWLEPIIEDIEKTYEEAVTIPYIRKPKAYALFQVWKKIDTAEKEKRRDE